MARPVATWITARRAAPAIIVHFRWATPIAASPTWAAADRPVRRFALIEHALAPWVEKHDLAGRPEVDQLVRDLAVTISAESLFTLLDLCGLTPDEAIASLAATARRLTAAAVASI